MNNREYSRFDPGNDACYQRRNDGSIPSFGLTVTAPQDDNAP
jgi:hypothetical protein